MYTLLCPLIKAYIKLNQEKNPGLIQKIRLDAVEAKKVIDTVKSRNQSNRP